MVLKMIKRQLLKLRTRIKRVLLPVKVPANWDERGYLVANPDVKAAIDSGLVSSGFEHWRQRGAFEGRNLGPDAFRIPSGWDEAGYLSSHPDVKEAIDRGQVSSGFEHWQKCGRFEERRQAVSLPKWVKDEMLALSEIEPKVFPSQAFCNRLMAYYPGKHDQSGASQLFVKLLKAIGDRSFTHVFLLPWLKAGGADLEALHHITTLSTEFGARILVILTENTKSPWLSRLPQSVTTLGFGRAAAGIDSLSAQIVLVRLLLKLRPPVIHNIHSAIGWEIFSRYGAALHSASKLYVSLLLFDYTPEGEPVGYARDLEKVSRYLDGVFSDNEAFPAKLAELYGVGANLFSVIRYPVRVATRFSYVPDEKPKILWAGRLDRQKRPDILYEIATCLPNCMFHVYGDRLLDSSDFSRRARENLSKLKNVTLFGKYDGFDSIRADNYVLFLYTTQWDGMPNVILEAMAAGLAVLAPNVGGINEVIRPESAFLVPGFDDVKGYVEAIQHLIANPRLIIEERDRGMQYLRDKHSPESFVASLAKISSYSLTESPDRPVEQNQANQMTSASTPAG
jgi:glycosyltransferase involved in cell wall biosynthesis